MIISEIGANKKTFYIFILLVFCFVNSTCKKANLYTFNLSGIWLGSGDGPCNVYLDITSDSKKSTYGGNTAGDNCYLEWHGTARVNNNHLYIGNTKFIFIEKPKLITNGDSIYGTGRFMQIHSVVTAEMTLKNSFFHGRNIYKFKRIKEY